MKEHAEAHRHPLRWRWPIITTVCFLQDDGGPGGQEMLAKLLLVIRSGRCNPGAAGGRSVGAWRSALPVRDHRRCSGSSQRGEEAACGCCRRMWVRQACRRGGRLEGLSWCSIGRGLRGSLMGQVGRACLSSCSRAAAAAASCGDSGPALVTDWLRLPSLLFCFSRAEG